MSHLCIETNILLQMCTLGVYYSKPFICSDESKSPSFVFHPLGHSRARNKDVSTVIVGGIQRGEEGAATYHALASLDGMLINLCSRTR